MEHNHHKKDDDFPAQDVPNLEDPNDLENPTPNVAVAPQGEVRNVRFRSLRNVRFRNLRNVNVRVLACLLFWFLVRHFWEFIVHECYRKVIDKIVEYFAGLNGSKDSVDKNN